MESVSKEDYQSLARVRKEIWTKGFTGFAVGSSSAVLLHTAANLVNRYHKLPFALNRNTLMASFFLGGAVGSFALATAAGKNEVHNLHHIFPYGANPPPKPYDKIKEEATIDTWKKNDEVTVFDRK